MRHLTVLASLIALAVTSTAEEAATGLHVSSWGGSVSVHVKGASELFAAQGAYVIVSECTRAGMCQFVGSTHPVDANAEGEVNWGQDEWLMTEEGLDESFTLALFLGTTGGGSQLGNPETLILRNIGTIYVEMDAAWETCRRGCSPVLGNGVKIDLEVEYHPPEKAAPWSDRETLLLATRLSRVNPNPVWIGFASYDGECRQWDLLAQSHNCDEQSQAHLSMYTNAHSSLLLPVTAVTAQPISNATAISSPNTTANPQLAANGTQSDPSEVLVTNPNTTLSDGVSVEANNGSSPGAAAVEEGRAAAALPFIDDSNSSSGASTVMEMSGAPGGMLILAFHGAHLEETEDVIVDPDAELTDCFINDVPCGRVNENFLRTYFAIRTGLNEGLRTALQSNDDESAPPRPGVPHIPSRAATDVLITGHGLGGTLALLALFDLATNHDLLQSLARVRTIALGTPQVGDAAWRDAFNEAVASAPALETPLRVVAADYTHTDLLSHLPRCAGGIVDSAAEYVHVGSRIYLFPDGAMTASRNSSYIRTPDQLRPSLECLWRLSDTEAPTLKDAYLPYASALSGLTQDTCFGELPEGHPEHWSKRPKFCTTSSASLPVILSVSIVVAILAIFAAVVWITLLRKQRQRHRRHGGAKGPVAMLAARPVESGAMVRTNKAAVSHSDCGELKWKMAKFLTGMSTKSSAHQKEGGETSKNSSQHASGSSGRTVKIQAECLSTATDASAAVALVPMSVLSKYVTDDGESAIVVDIPPMQTAPPESAVLTEVLDPKGKSKQVAAAAEPVNASPIMMMYDSTPAEGLSEDIPDRLLSPGRHHSLPVASGLPSGSAVVSTSRPPCVYRLPPAATSDDSIPAVNFSEFSALIQECRSDNAGSSTEKSAGNSTSQQHCQDAHPAAERMGITSAVEQHGEAASDHHEGGAWPDIPLVDSACDVSQDDEDEDESTSFRSAASDDFDEV
eukprot:CAMPEP_0177756458 /NCGR_PEP_ID=MMETSP0491_2-20121128/3117_1 /TAXON_ID=63592 /ORGANISM="Tetraselmis chuii, Strain PLY429" /LENGTH=964 /DNA_ID=CAMNT_0019272037 /DNA_START=487 /DNA_END=3381 /DNA_ORIENTATION=+